MNHSLLLAQSLIARKVILKLCWFGTRCNISSVTLQPKNEAAEKIRLVASRNCKTWRKLICYFFSVITIYIHKGCVSAPRIKRDKNGENWRTSDFVWIYYLHTCDMYQLYAKYTVLLTPFTVSRWDINIHGKWNFVQYLNFLLNASIFLNSRL